MRIRPVVAIFAMLLIMGGFVRWVGGTWVHVMAVLGAIVLFVVGVIRLYRDMYDDDWD